MPRTRGTALAFAALLLAAHPLSAAEIQGQVLHPSQAAETANLEVRLLGLGPDGSPFSAETRSDARGRFHFSDLGVPAAYLILVQYQGVGFHGETLRFTAEQETETQTLLVEVHPPSDDPSTIRLDRIRIFLEREADTFRWDQVVDITNTGDRVVALGADAPPALRIALAAGHGELRTPTGLTPSGFELRGDQLELRGPIFPGPRELRFSYDLPARPDLRAELFFPDGVPSLELYVRDDRFAIDVRPLHSARVSRDGDGAVYQRFLGFDLAPGSRIPLAIAPLPPVPAGGSLATALAAAAIAGALLFFVGRPVTMAIADHGEAREDAATLEKEALFAALRDLEHDFDTGKLSTADRDRLRDELRRDTLAALARTSGSASGPAPAAPRHCAGCGRDADPGAKFCAECGSAL